MARYRRSSDELTVLVMIDLKNPSPPWTFQIALNQNVEELDSSLIAERFEKDEEKRGPSGRVRQSNPVGNENPKMPGAHGVVPHCSWPGARVAADNGYDSEEDARMVIEEGIEGCLPDNRFRKRDPALAAPRWGFRPILNSDSGRI
jgi:hypothetical protein